MVKIREKVGQVQKFQLQFSTAVNINWL